MMMAPDEGGMIKKHEPESILSKNETRTVGRSFTNIKTNARFSCHVGVNKIKNTIKQQFSTGKKYTYTTLQCPDTKQNQLSHAKHNCTQKTF